MTASALNAAEEAVAIARSMSPDDGGHIRIPPDDIVRPVQGDSVREDCEEEVPNFTNKSLLMP